MVLEPSRNKEFIYAELDIFHAEYTITCIIEGEAPGADTIAKAWATIRGIPYEKYPADWETYGRAAGPIRNREMLQKGQPERVIAFIDKPLAESRGTKNMVTISSRAGVPVKVHELGGVVDASKTKPL